MNRITRAITAASILAIAPASARIGESSAQCEARYGSAVERSLATDGTLESTIHHKRGFSITILYHGDIATTLILQPRGITEADRTPFSDVQIQSILRSNAPKGIPWKQTEDTRHPTRTDLLGDPIRSRRWQTSDGKILASHSTGTDLLILITAAQKRANEAARAAAQKSTVADF